MTALLVPMACADEEGASTDSPAPPPPGAPEASVTISDMAFSPDDVEVAVGDVVSWTFDDGHVPHNVTFDDGTSSDTKDGGSWRRSFDEPGTYEYHCTLHSQMQGTVTVS